MSVSMDRSSLSHPNPHDGRHIYSQWSLLPPNDDSTKEDLMSTCMYP